MCFYLWLCGHIKSYVELVNLISSNLCYNDDEDDDRNEHKDNSNDNDDDDGSDCNDIRNDNDNNDDHDGN